MTQNELFAALNKDLEYYIVVPVKECLGEEGKMIKGEEPVGYACVNKITDIVEHTSTLLAGVIYQAQHFDNTLRAVTEIDVEIDPETPADDVVLN